MKHLILKTVYFIITIMAIFPIVGYASELRFDSSKVEVRIGEEFVVTAVLYADETVNAVEGVILFPDNLLTVKQIHDGNSSINFWVEKPKVDSFGRIVYSGVTPGGFSGVNNVLFSIVFEAKESGDARIFSEASTVLQDDGFGTELVVNLRDVEIEIRKGDGSAKNEIIEDTELPEIFTPKVAQDPSVFGGDYFLVFATQDKGSGIKHYEVREGRFGWFKKAESPYLLANQKLDRDLYVRVTDNVGNKRVVVVPAVAKRPLWEHFGLFVIITILVAIAVVYKKSWTFFLK